jgi:hypothetical protein
LAVDPISAKLLHDGPWHRSTRYAVTPTLSVAAVQLTVICDPEAVALTLGGAVGGAVSGVDVMVVTSLAVLLAVLTSPPRSPPPYSSHSPARCSPH